MIILLFCLLFPSELKSTVVSYLGFNVEFSDHHKQAIQVNYMLTKSMLMGYQYNRQDKFYSDPNLGTADNADYLRSGYDRGHLCPAADMSWDSMALIESFCFSNISPQVPSFNRGKWKDLEQQVRNWAKIYDTLYIVTGGVLENNLPTLGKNKVSIPAYFYKVIYFSTQKKGIGFIMPNQPITSSIENFAVSIDSVESVTNINFFSGISNEDLIEKQLCIECFKWIKK